MNLLWSPLALVRAQEIADHIADDNPDAARACVLGLFEVVHTLQQFPLSGRQVPEIKRQNIREIIWRKHRVIYRYQEEQVQILTILHGRQWLDPTLTE
jgi:plasmid stabilization system protein ParE